MTREKEIKDKLETYQVKYIHWQSGRQLDIAEDDIEYLLARNGELQRRVNHLEEALQFYARLDDDMGYDEIEEDHGRRAVDALDAKEQNND